MKIEEMKAFKAKQLVAVVVREIRNTLGDHILVEYLNEDAREELENLGYTVDEHSDGGYKLSGW